jgi:flagellar protein FliO/FliZ
MEKEAWTMMWTSLLLAGVTLLVVLALVLLAARLARLGGLAPRTALGGDRMALLQVLALDQRRRLHLVRCDGRHVLLLVGGAEDRVVGWLDAGGGPA